MEVLDWLNFAARWIHLIVGIAWIGSSFYFVFLDDVLEPTAEDPERKILQGESWQVHGGGFYHMRKYKVAPASLPDHLHWFKWEAYATWISGMCLLFIVYYAQASAMLVPIGRDLPPLDATAAGLGVLLFSWIVYDALCRSALARNEMLLGAIGVVFAILLAFGLTHLFTGRGALIHLGAALGTIMAVNVFAVIIPSQEKAVAILLKGQVPDPKYGLLAKQRSRHNTYLTLPVLFLMLSNHYPMIYENPHSWLIVLGLAIIGALVRHVFVLRHTHRSKPWMLPALGVALALLAWVVMANPPGVATASPQIASAASAAKATPEAADDPRAARPVAPFAEVRAIVSERCLVCHGAKPTYPGIAEPPKGVVLDTPGGLRQWAQAIRQQVVIDKTMPLSNATNMQPEERAIIDHWIASGAKVPGS